MVALNRNDDALAGLGLTLDIFDGFELRCESFYPRVLQGGVFSLVTGVDFLICG